MELNSNRRPIIEIPEIGLVIDDLVGGNSGYIDEYLKIYNELLPQYFRYAPVMRQRAEKLSDKSSNEKWHQGLIWIHNQPAGMIGILYNRRRNTGIMLDFAIKSEVRDIKYSGHQRLAGLILQLAIEQLIGDARENGHQYPICMIAEVEHSTLVRKYFEYGYKEFPIEYYEPPYTPELVESSKNIENLDKIGFKKLHLGAFEVRDHPFDPKDPSTIKTVLLSLLEDHYKLPSEHWLLQKLLQDIPV